MNVISPFPLLRFMAKLMGLPFRMTAITCRILRCREQSPGSCRILCRSHRHLSIKNRGFGFQVMVRETPQAGT